MWLNGPEWMLTRSQWHEQPEELKSVELYSQYLANLKKEKAQYEIDTHTLLINPAPLSSQVLVSKARPPVKIRTYDEPLTNILFRDHTLWTKVVTSYAFVLRWIDKLRSRIAQKRATPRVQTRSLTQEQRQA
jgi:hypothetical protein